MVFNSVIKKYNGMSEALKATLWFFVCTFLQKGISLITTPIFTRLMSKEEYGIYSVYVSWSDVLSIFITLGLASSVYQKKLIQLDSEKERAILTSSLQGLATLTALISFTVYWSFHEKINSWLSLPTEMVIAVFASVLSTTAFTFWAMRQRVMYKYRKLIALTLFTSAAKPILGIIAVLSFPDHKVHARVFTIVGVEVCAYLFIYIKQFAEGKRFFDFSYWKYALIYVIPLIPHYLSQRILSQSDRIMIKSMIGAGEAGIYSLAYSIGMIVNMVINTLDNTLAPWTYQNIKGKKYDNMRRLSFFVILMIAAAGILFTIVVPELVAVFAAKEYGEAVWIVPLFVIDAFFIAVYTFFIYFEYYFEKTKFIMIATMFAAILNITLNSVFIKLFGYIAAAYTSTVCYMIYCTVHYLIFRFICRHELDGAKPYNIKGFVVIAVIFIAAEFGIMNLYGYPFIRYLLVAAILATAFIKRKKIMEMVSVIRNKNQPQS